MGADGGGGAMHHGDCAANGVGREEVQTLGKSRVAQRAFAPMGGVAVEAQTALWVLVGGKCVFFVFGAMAFDVQLFGQRLGGRSSKSGRVARVNA